MHATEPLHSTAGMVFACPLTLAALVRCFARSDQASERPASSEGSLTVHRAGQEAPFSASPIAARYWLGA